MKKLFTSFVVALALVGCGDDDAVPEQEETEQQVVEPAPPPAPKIHTNNNPHGRAK